MTKYKIGNLLQQIGYPKDLRKLDRDQLPELASEVRNYIIDVISEIGHSHFGASLGAVELAVALHYVFDTPNDLLVWDVGHQAYAHKILTGRRDVFPTNREKGGISGFPSRSESEYDPFGVGHSSTSISAIMGMAVADRYKGITNRHHIAVIGDGAMTAGMAFEALNHAGYEKDTNLLVILNDNCMSIDPNVGALKGYLTSISKAYKESNIFESLDFRYFGPVDGHDVVQLSLKLEELKKIDGPKILHCITKKGKGYKYSEEGDPTQWHAPGVFNKETGEFAPTSNGTIQPPKYQNVFGNTLVELARKNENIVGITPAMPTGSSLNIMMKEMPNRAFDVGIAEQHAVTFAAGMATQGLIPFCVIYSTFLQRGYDQLIHDVALQDLPVVFCLDRAGLVGADGATHHGVFDIAYLRCIPNMIVAAPMNEPELRNFMYTAQLPLDHPIAIRYPRGRGVTPDWKQPMTEIPIGKGRKICDGNQLAILTFGHPGNYAQEAIREVEKEGCSVALYDMRFVKPLDEELLTEVFTQFDKVITVEDGVIQGGFGSAVLEFMNAHHYTGDVIRLGVPDKFIQHGTQSENQHDVGIDTVCIVATIRRLAKV